MSDYKIFFSNLGYAKGIDGSLKSHVLNFHRHFYAGPVVQKEILDQAKSIVIREQPDICCFVEIDQGSLHSGYYNQLESLLDEEYAYFDITNKYGKDNVLGQMPLHTGKSNAFVSKYDINFEHQYFKSGQKRLIYKLELPDGATLFFAHFSLNKKVREKQFTEILRMADEVEGEVMIMADFNILHGFAELAPLLYENRFVVMNREEEFTFAFHDRQHTLDLCLCSQGLAERTELKIITQPYSDHEALLAEVSH